MKQMCSFKRMLGWVLLAFIFSAGTRLACAYSLLSHEEVVDMAWHGYMIPLIEKRYPGITRDELTKCHAYAYGGSVIQDMGYYPFGSKEFSDLLHYVRSDAFVDALLRDSTTPEEYAFALGALAHYYGDTVGHPMVNIITGEEYPRLRKRFGRVVTYEDDSKAHLRNEFGFDVVEVAQGVYSQQHYRDFIGFQVAEPLMNRAFEETYGLPIADLLGDEDLSIMSYRYSVSKIVPEMTKIALAGYGKQIQKANPGVAKSEFRYRLSRTNFEKEYGRQFQHPTIGARIMAFFIDLLPKVGPFSGLRLHLPNSAEQTQYLASFNSVETAFRDELKAVSAAPAHHPPRIQEMDFDTGKLTTEGEYRLADLTYAEWIEHLARDNNAHITPGIIKDINHFYRNPKAEDAVKQRPEGWAKLQTALQVVRDKKVTDRAQAPQTSAAMR